MPVESEVEPELAVVPALDLRDIGRCGVNKLAVVPALDLRELGRCGIPAPQESISMVIGRTKCMRNPQFNPPATKMNALAVLDSCNATQEEPGKANPLTKATELTLSLLTKYKDNPDLNLELNQLYYLISDGLSVVTALKQANFQHSNKIEMLQEFATHQFHKAFQSADQTAKIKSELHAMQSQISNSAEIEFVEQELVSTKTVLAQQKEANDLANKLIRYYVMHMKQCDPSYIIPAQDTKRIRDLQLDDLPSIRSPMTPRVTSARMDKPAWESPPPKKANEPNSARISQKQSATSVRDLSKWVKSRLSGPSKSR